MIKANSLGRQARQHVTNQNEAIKYLLYFHAMTILLECCGTSQRIHTHTVITERLTQDIAAMVRRAFPHACCLLVLASHTESAHIVFTAVLRGSHIPVLLSVNPQHSCGTILVTENPQQLKDTLKKLEISGRDRILVISSSGWLKFPVEYFNGATVMVGYGGSVYRLSAKSGLQEISAALPNPSSSSFIPNFRGRRLRVCTFACPPFSYGIKNTRQSTDPQEDNDFEGVEASIFLEISRRLNLDWVLQEPTGEHLWGKQMENGSWSGGIIGALHTHKADVAFCYIWLTTNSYNSIDVTTPWIQVCNTLLVPRPKKIVRWKAIFSSLQPEVWLGLLLVMCLTAVCFWFLAHVDSRNTSLFYRLDSSLMATLGMLLLTSSTALRQYTSRSKPLLYLWLWFSLLATTAYSSNLAAVLTIPAYGDAIDTVEDAVRAGLFWEESFLPYMELIFDIENPWHKKFVDRFRLVKEESTTLVENQALQAFRIIGPFQYMHLSSSARREHLMRLTAMKECLSTYYIVFGLVKQSPLTDAFNRMLSSMAEAGIVQHMLQHVLRYPTQPHVHTAGRTRLSVRNVLGGFCLWALGIVVAIIAFGLEVIIKRRRLSKGNCLLLRHRRLNV